MRTVVTQSAQHWPNRWRTSWQACDWPADCSGDRAEEVFRVRGDQVRAISGNGSPCPSGPMGYPDCPDVASGTDAEYTCPWDIAVAATAMALG